MKKSTTILSLFQYFTFTTAAITTSIFVPQEYLSNTFDVSIAGAASSITTYLFSPGCALGPCGPVRLTQGPGTAIYTADNVPSGGVTTAWTCELKPISGDPTRAECTLTSTAPWGCCSGSETKHYPIATGYAFPIYEAVVTAGGEGIGGVRPTETLFTQSDPGAPATSTATATAASASTSSGGSVTSTSMSGTGTLAASTASVSSAQTTDSSSVLISQASVESASSTSVQGMPSSSTAAADSVVQRHGGGFGSTIVGVISLLLGLIAL